MEGVKIRLTIDSNLENVFLVGRSVGGICSYYGLGAEECYKIELAVVDGGNNAILHAYDSEPGNEVAVVVTADRKRIGFEILDSGKAMDRGKRGKPNAEVEPGDSAALPESGRGWFIMQEIMDEVSYEAGPRWNRLVLVKKLETKRK